MKNNKVLVLASLLAVGLVTGCGKKNNPSVSSQLVSTVTSANSEAASETTTASVSEAPSAVTSDATSNTPAVSETTSEVQEVNDNKVLISELPDGDITQDLTKDIFTFVRNADTTESSAKKAMTVATAGETGPITFNEVEYSKVLKTQSASSLAADKVARVIKFQATGKGSVKVVAKTPTEGDARKLALYNVDNSVEHDSVMVNEMNEYVLTFHYAGTYYITTGANLSIYSIEAAWEDGVNESDWKPTIKLTNDLFLNANEIPSGAITADLEFTNFVIKATAEKDQGIQVDGSNKTVDGIKYSQRIKLGGAGTYDYRSVIVKTTDAARITVHCMSSSSSADRKLAIFDTSIAMDAEGAKLDEGTATGSGMAALTFTVDGAGSYALLGTEGGVNIYGVTIEYAA